MLINNRKPHKHDAYSHIHISKYKKLSVREKCKII